MWRNNTMTQYRFIAKHRGTDICREFVFESIKAARKANPDFVEWEYVETVPKGQVYEGE
jgi:hypothetical protein